jgi:hypothetical protein
MMICAGAPLFLVEVGLRGKDERAEHVRQLLLESPYLEHGMMSALDSWLDVLHFSEDVRMVSGRMFSS